MHGTSLEASFMGKIVRLHLSIFLWMMTKFLYELSSHCMAISKRVSVVYEDLTRVAQIMKANSSY